MLGEISSSEKMGLTVKKVEKSINHRTESVERDKKKANNVVLNPISHLSYNNPCFYKKKNSRMRKLSV